MRPTTVWRNIFARRWKILERSVEQPGIAFQAEVIEVDFIRAAVDLLADCPLWGTVHSAFDCAILNPPYRKLNSESERRKADGCNGWDPDQQPLCGLSLACLSAA